MKNILVTGACGHIGKHAIRALIDAGADVTGIDVKSSSPDSRIKYIEGNIFDSSFVETLNIESFDACLHLAWRNGFKHNDSSHLLDLSSHYSFLEFLIKKNIPKIAVMGTMHEIGYWEGVINESTPCNPESLYGVSKDCLRKALFLSALNTDTTVQWLRGFYIYGNDEDSPSIFGKILDAEKQGLTTFPFTTGKNKYDFLHINDLAFQLSACVLQDEVTGIINCCSGSPKTLSEQVEEFILNNNLKIKLDYGAFPDRPYDSPAIWGDSSKIERVLKLMDESR